MHVSAGKGGQRKKSTPHLLGNVVIGNAEETHNTGPSARQLPVELAGVVLLVGSEAQDGAEGADGDDVAKNDRVGGVVADALTGATPLSLGPVLLELLGRLALQLVDLALDAVGLGLGLYGLRLEVGGDGRDVRGVDIDQRVGGFVGVGNLGNGRGATGFRS